MSQSVFGFQEIFFVRTDCDIIVDGYINCIYLIQDELIIDIAHNKQYNTLRLN